MHPGRGHFTAGEHTSIKHYLVSFKPLLNKLILPGGLLFAALSTTLTDGLLGNGILAKPLEGSSLVTISLSLLTALCNFEDSSDFSLDSLHFTRQKRDTITITALKSFFENGLIATEIQRINCVRNCFVSKVKNLMPHASIAIKYNLAFRLSSWNKRILFPSNHINFFKYI